MTPANTLHAQTKLFAKDNPLRSWWCILSTSALLLLAVAGTFPFPHHLLALRIASCVFAGLLSVRLFVIYHDQQHRAILPKSRLAELYMRVFGVLVLCPSTIWRSSHDYHHAHNSKLRSAHIGSFPIMTAAHYRECSWGERFQYMFMRHPLTILFGYFFVFLIGMVVVPALQSPRKHYDSIIALCVHIAIGVVLVMTFGWLTMALALVLPLFIASAIGTYLFYAQHNFPTVTFKDKAGWTYEGAALDSSSYLKTNRIMEWFTANIGYHHIHHLNHRIPFYRLPETYRAIPELQKAKTTSLNPLDIFRCLRLKVWCPESQRMVGVRGR